MSCGNEKNQLNTQLEDLEKNRGVLNIMKTSLISNPFFAFVANLALANQPAGSPPITTNNFIDKVFQQVLNPIGLVQTMLSALFAVPGNFLSCYYYYLLQTQLVPWLIKRRDLAERILWYLREVHSLTESNFYFRLSPSADKEYRTLMSFLEAAQVSLMQVPYVKITRRDENGNIIQQGYELPGSIPISAIGMENFNLLEDTPIFYFTLRAFTFLEEAQRFLRNLISTKQLTEYEKELQERLAAFLSQNNTILSELSAMIPVPLMEILTSLDFVKKTIKQPLGTIAQQSLGLGTADTLVLLNGRVGIMKAMLSKFTDIVKSFSNEVNQSIQRELARYHNIELDALIADIKGKEYPINLFDFYLKAPAWYARIEVIKYSLLFFDVNKFTLKNYELNENFKLSHERIKQLLKLPDQGKLFEKGLISSFPEIVKILYIGNLFGANRKTMSMEYLIELGNNTILQDTAFLDILTFMEPPDDYWIFEPALKSGMNLLQSTYALGPASNLVIEGVQTGLFLALPSVVGLPTGQALETTLNSISSVSSIVPGIQEFSSYLDYLKGGFSFESCDTLKEKNLFLRPNVNNPTPEEIIDGIGDAYEELWTSIAGRME